VRTACDHAPFYLADRRALYAARGLDVTVHLVPSNTEIIEALQRGDLQVGAVPVTTAIAAIARGLPLSIVAMTGRGSDGLLARIDGPDTVAGLAGQRIATIRASILDLFLREALHAEGLDPERDTEMVWMTGLGDMIGALRTAQVDAVSNTEPFLSDAEHAGWGRVICHYNTLWPEHPCCVVVTHHRFAEQRPEALTTLLAIHQEAVAWANAHVRETAETIVATMGGFEVAVVEAALRPERMRIDWRITPEEIDRMAALMVRHGLLEGAPSSQEMLDLSHLPPAGAEGS